MPGLPPLTHDHAAEAGVEFAGRLEARVLNPRGIRAQQARRLAGMRGDDPAFALVGISCQKIQGVGIHHHRRPAFTRAGEERLRPRGLTEAGTDGDHVRPVEQRSQVGRVGDRMTHDDPSCR